MSCFFSPPAGADSDHATRGEIKYWGPSVDLNDFGALFLPQILAARQGSLTMQGAESRILFEDVPLGGWNEPTIAVNPSDPLNIAYASLFELRVSTDGGTTWRDPVPSRVPATHVMNGDPSLAFDRDGRLYWSYLGAPFEYPFLLGSDIFIAQCDPRTGTILPGYPINVTEGIGMPGYDGNTHDKEWLAADFHASSPFANRLYLVWTRFPPVGNEVTLTSRSSDQGMTWSSAVQLGGATGAFIWPTHVTVAPNGDVYAADHRQPGFVGGAPNGVSGYVNVYRSTDGGVSFPQQTQAFTAGQADMSFNVQTTVGAIPGAEFWLQGSVQPWVLADPSIPGRIYVVANDDPDNNVQAGDAADVYLVRSTDHGATWGSPGRVDSGPGMTFQVMPTAAIDPESGAICVHYYDNRSGARNADLNFLLDVFAAVSIDGGSTFLPDFQVNDLPFDPDAGARCRLDCGTLITDVWADTGGMAAYAVAISGHFLAYDGNLWSAWAPSSTPKFGVWGTSATDVFVCGSGGEILHYDGSQFTAQASNTVADLFGLDGRSPSDVFAVGGDVVTHYDGSNWALISPGDAVGLRHVWANPTGDAWVVGKHGAVKRYDGFSWADVSLGADETLDGVWGSSDDDVYVTSTSGALYHWNGASWTLIDSGLATLTAVWGSSPTDVLALGFGRIRRFDGNTWSSEDISEHLLLSLHGSGAANIFVVGEHGFIAHYDGSSWTQQGNPLAPSTPTERVGEYNGVAAAGGRSVVVWCGNTQSEPPSDPLDQQTIFDSFPTRWQVDVVDLAARPSEIVLEALRPNPAHRSATVAYALPRSGRVDLSLVDAQGRRIATLASGVQPAGRHVVSWDSRDGAGNDVKAGVYFLSLRAGQELHTKKVTLVR